jgi:hypothetical protein
MYAHSLGYGVRQKHLLRCRDCPVGKENSNHKISLAIDIRLTINGQLVEDYRKHHNILHTYWDKLGGAPRIDHDLGHYSFEWRGRW